MRKAADREIRTRPFSRPHKTTMIQIFVEAAGTTFLIGLVLGGIQHYGPELRAAAQRRR